MAQLPQTTANHPATTGGTTKRKFDPIPENRIVNVVVEECEVRAFDEAFRRQWNVQDTHEVSFRFRVKGGDYDNRVVFGSAKPIFEDDPDCRLRLWTQELMGVDTLPDNYVFDTDDLVGRSGRILVRVHTKQNGEQTNKVKEVLRAENQPVGTERVYDEEPF